MITLFKWWKKKGNLNKKRKLHESAVQLTLDDSSVKTPEILGSKKEEYRVHGKFKKRLKLKKLLSYACIRAIYLC